MRLSHKGLQYALYSIRPSVSVRLSTCAGRALV